jgi:hypothetical protein
MSPVEALVGQRTTGDNYGGVVLVQQVRGDGIYDHIFQHNNQIQMRQLLVV